MPDQNTKPVVLLIYANTGAALDSLKPETEAIESHLAASNLCDIRIVPAATLADVVTAINDPAIRDRVSIVHYAGHSNGRGIQLQSSSEAAQAQGEIAYMRGLAQVLATQPHLRLLFINGCASREQVLELTQAGIPLVIATNRGIDDKVACEFAKSFYRTLGQQRSIADAFQVAAGMVESAVGDNVRGLYFGEFQASEPAKKSELPWELHGPDADRHWSLREPYYRGSGPRWDHTKFAFNPESPYLGLRYFSEEESSRFFGRDEFVQALLTAGESAPLLLVIGASGSGKSSVVRAGMIPHWKKKNGGASRVRVFVFTPQDDPFEQLSTALASVDSFDRQQIRRIRETPSRTALRDAVKTFGQGEPWLLFVDQFEQIFTRTADQAKRAAFLDSIADLAKSEHLNVCLVLAMRDDFFPQLRDYPELFPLTDKHCFRVAALSRAALQEVIERPAAEHGVALQPGLADNIIEAVDRQPGELPLLQYSLDALWKADDLSDRLLNETTYNDLGGVTGSLGRRLQNLYDQQEQSGKDQFRWMMLKLVTYDESSGGATAVSRLAPKSEFEGKQAELLDQLIAQGLVVSSGTATPSVQLGHEKVIEAWAEFTQWTQEYREANTVRQQLSKAASEWAALNERHERKKAVRALWQGSQLEKALELRQRGDFNQLGGLNANEVRFLDASHSRTKRLVRGLQWAAGIAITLALLSWWNYLKAVNNARDARRQESNAYWQLGVTDRAKNNSIKAALNFLKAAQASNNAGEITDLQQQRNIELASQYATSSLIRSFPHDAGVTGIQITRNDSRVLAWSEEGVLMLWDVTQTEPLQLWQHDRAVISAVFTRDESRVLSWSGDGAVKLWDVTQAEPLQVWRHDGFVNGAVFARDESRVLTWGGDGAVKLWDVMKAEPLQVWQHGSNVSGAVFSHDESQVLTWIAENEVGEVNLWEVTKAQPLQMWQHDDVVNGAVFTRDESRVLSWSGDGAVKLWDVTKSEPLQVWQHDDSVRGGVFTRDESRVLAWSDDGAMKLWDVMNAEPLQVWKHDGFVLEAVFTRDQSRVLARSANTVKLWEVGNPEPLQVWQHDEVVNGAVFTRDEARVLTWSGDGSVKLWDVTKSEPLQVWQHDDPVRGAIFTRDESRVLAWSGDFFRAGEVKLWGVTQAEPLQVWQHESEINGAVFTRDESRVATWSGNFFGAGAVKLWDVTQAEPLRAWKYDNAVNGAVFTRDNSRVLAWSGNAVKLWDVTQGEPLAVWQHDGFVNGAVFSRDDSRVLTWSDDGAVKLWGVTKAEPLQAWQLDCAVNGAVFSRDESRVLAWSGDFNAVELKLRDESRVPSRSVAGEVKLWDVTQVEPLQAWQHDGFVNGAVFSHGESRVLSWRSDSRGAGKLNLWEVTQTEPSQVWQHDDVVYGAVFARDDSRVLAWSGDFSAGEIKLWDVTQAEPLHVWQHKRVVRGAVFTRDESRVLAWSGDFNAGEVKLWDVTEAEPLRVWQYDNAVNGAVFNRDESRVLAWSGDFNAGEVKLWDVTSAEPLQVWKHDRDVNGAVFTRDESRILTWSDDGAVKLWDVTKAEPLQVWQHDGPVLGAIFTRDESRVLTWSGDPEAGAVTLWDSAMENRDLTPTERTTELEVRSASRLDSAGQLVAMKSAEWISRVRSPEYAAIQQKLKAAESSDPSK